MKELITFVLKPLSFLPALAIMYIIYSFSGQTGEESGNLSYEVSVKIVEIGNQVLDKDFRTGKFLKLLPASNIRSANLHI